MSLNKPTKKDIIFLFDNVWPAMNGAAIHREGCLKQIDRIIELFNKYKTDPDQLIISLLSLDNVGLVVASGLIYSANRKSMVPFDKYTTGYAIQLGIINNNRIVREGNYTQASKRVLDYIENNPSMKNIRDFVLRAREDTHYPISPE
ncbi:hypothetical protein [Fuchsiella alkaliacetigena]|uniref:hypothetical protein n=1 Tax=Fuchsiella alkaliacetigena TaxID=957042 RepID=UPI00200B2615|nr:hypothetical protein [Fuchsiella alkaliacetigena]MCK8825397.1 hypothetical protein [Fuchsiella alkaliacetigena]